MARSGLILIVDDGAGVGRLLSEQLEARGYRVARVTPATATGGDPAAPSADLGSPEGVAALVDQIHDRLGPASAIIHLAALRPGAGEGGPHPAPSRAHPTEDLRSLFLLAQAFRPDLERAAADGGAVLMAATAQGGSFACDPAAGPSSPGQGALAGFLKSLAQEWPDVRIKAVDVDAAGPPEVAGRLGAELFSADGLVEVGYRDDRRVRLALVPAALPGIGAGPLPIDDGSVVLITGGARGITAAAALALAEAARPTLLLVGRTPPSGAEPPELVSLSEPQALRRALIERHRGDGRPITPAVVEAQLRQLLQGREVRDTLERLRRAGSRVEYLTCDVRDSDAFGALIDAAYRDHGRIDGVIHGAGIIEDKLVRDKAPDSFDRVVETKVRGALALAGRLRPDSLRFLVFFGSVSGRFGNRGQGDYAAASEVLNKLAQDLDRRWPGRVVSINWGPWLTTGMVSPEVHRQFAERQVALIPPDVGCRMLLEELRSGRKGEAEVLIGGSTGPGLVPEGRHVAANAGTAGIGRTPADDRRDVRPLPMLAGVGPLHRGDRGSVEVVRRLDPEQDLYLRDHCLDDRPVLPFAVAMELMAEVAAAARPDLEVVDVRDVRLLRGVVIGWDGQSVRVVASPKPPGSPGGPDDSDRAVLDVTITAADDPRRLHYRASVELATASSAGRGGDVRGFEDDAPLEGLGPPPFDAEDAYRDWLFHGPQFQRIAAIEGFGPGGARASMRPSSPREALGAAVSGDWLIDPILIDCAFQMQVLWARRHWGVTLLPSGVGSYRRVAAMPPRDGAVRYELRIRSESQAPLCHADHRFYGEGGRLLGVLTDVAGTGSASLNRPRGEPSTMSIPVEGHGAGGGGDGARLMDDAPRWVRPGVARRPGTARRRRHHRHVLPLPRLTGPGRLLAKHPGQGRLGDRPAPRGA